MTQTKLTVEQFSKKHGPFLKACKLAGIEPSKNEASKYRRGIGKAIECSNEKWRVNPHQQMVKCNKCAGTGQVKKKRGPSGICRNCFGKGTVAV